MIKKYLTMNTILGFTLCVAIAFVFGDLAFSITTYHDTAVFILLLLVFICYIFVQLKKDKQQVYQRIICIYKSSKWLLISLFLYVIYDLITIIYARNLLHALNEIPYMFEYISICLIAVYYCSTKKRIIFVVSTIGITGLIVALSAYIYYFVSLNPIYFQRLSTARDYNVFACLLFVSFIFAAYLIIYEFKLSFAKRVLIYSIISLLIIPVFYFSGSRRMFVMLPYMLLFVVIYEALRLKRKLIKNLFFVFLPVAVYLSAAILLPAFSQYGAKKETAYKNWVKAQQSEGIPIKNGGYTNNENTIGNVIKTIEDKTMMNKRSIIYKTAFNELKSYTPVEWVFGRGNAYDIYMYDVTKDKDFLEAYNILKYNIRPIGLMSAHNFMLADILNGGIVGLLLCLFVVVQIFIHVLKVIKIKPQIGSISIVMFCLIVINNFISGKYGMTNDLFFYILLMMIISILAISDNNIEVKSNENLHNDECASA